MVPKFQIDSQKVPNWLLDGYKVIGFQKVPSFQTSSYMVPRLHTDSWKAPEPRPPLLQISQIHQSFSELLLKCLGDYIYWCVFVCVSVWGISKCLCVGISIVTFNRSIQLLPCVIWKIRTYQWGFVSTCSCLQAGMELLQNTQGGKSCSSHDSKITHHYSGRCLYEKVIQVRVMASRTFHLISIMLMIYNCVLAYWYIHGRNGANHFI